MGGLVAAVVFGALGGLLHAIATVTFGVDHIVSGVAINILGLGVTRFLASIAARRTPGRRRAPSRRRSAGSATLSRPGRRQPLRTLEGKHWFLVSDLAGIVRGVPTNLSYVTLIAILLVLADVPGAVADRRSGCGCARAVRTRTPPSRSA